MGLGHTKDSTHNTFLRMVGDMGLPGLLLFLFLTVDRRIHLGGAAVPGRHEAAEGRIVGAGHGAEGGEFRRREAHQIQRRRLRIGHGLQYGFVRRFGQGGGPAELAYLAQSEVIYRSVLGRMPVALYPGMRICSFTFEQLSTPSSVPYRKKVGNKYSGQDRPLASKLSGEFKG